MKVLAPLAAAYILAFPSLAACQVGEGTPHSGEAERPDYSKSHGFPNILSPYIAPSVPVPRLDNSRRLQNLIVDGKLVLALDDAIALALENNLEIAVARYDLPIAQTELLRARGGGATRGVGGSVQSSTLFPGSLGGGVGSGGAASGTGAGGILGGGINNVSSARCCDPSLSVGYGWSNAITPLNYTVVTGVPIDTSHEALASVEYSQGFLTGTSLFVSESSSRLSSNSKTAIFNPELVSGLTVGVSQHLLKGFGVRANSRFIRIARNDLKYSASIFRQNVIVVVACPLSSVLRSGSQSAVSAKLLRMAGSIKGTEGKLAPKRLPFAFSSREVSFCASLRSKPTLPGGIIPVSAIGDDVAPRDAVTIPPDTSPAPATRSEELPQVRRRSP